MLYFLLIPGKPRVYFQSDLSLLPSPGSVCESLSVRLSLKTLGRRCDPHHTFLRKAVVCSEKAVCWAFTAKTRGQLRTLVFFKLSVKRLNQQPARRPRLLADSGLAALGSAACRGRSLFFFGVKCCKHIGVKRSPVANLGAGRSAWSSDACPPHGDKSCVGAPDLTSYADVDAPPGIAQRRASGSVHFCVTVTCNVLCSNPTAPEKEDSWRDRGVCGVLRKCA